MGRAYDRGAPVTRETTRKRVMQMATSEDARRFLRSYRRAIVKYESLNEEFERHCTRLFSRPLVANYGGGGGGGGTAGDTMGSNVAEFVDYKESIRDDLRAYAAIKADIWGIVNQVAETNERWGFSLHYRYIDGMSPTEAACEMGCADPSSERRDHARALEHVAAKWPDTIRRDLALLDGMCMREER